MSEPKPESECTALVRYERPKTKAKLRRRTQRMRERLSQAREEGEQLTERAIRAGVLGGTLGQMLGGGYLHDIVDGRLHGALGALAYWIESSAQAEMDDRKSAHARMTDKLPPYLTPEAKRTGVAVPLEDAVTMIVEGCDQLCIALGEQPGSAATRMAAANIALDLLAKLKLASRFEQGETFEGDTDD